MALIPCADCGTPMSRDAKACPRCGKPSPYAQMANARLLALVFIGVCVIAVLVFFLFVVRH